nr:hypothetical protein [Microbacterium testaceum]
MKSFLPKIREVIGGGITILVSVLLAWWGVASSQQIARDDDATQTAAQAEQVRQGETLERIEDTLQGLAGENPAPAQPTRDTPSGACTDDGTRFDGGWGPERPLFNDAVAPNYALMNSVLDNPNVGDERGFYGIKDAADTTPGGWRRSIFVERDHTYVLRIYVRNDSAHPTADALNARFMVNLPTCEGTSIESGAFVTSSTAFPIQTYSSVAMHSDEVFNVAYVADSLTVENNSEFSPFEIAGTDFLTQMGQPLGFDAMDGTMRPGYQYALYASFRVRPQFAPQ